MKDVFSGALIAVLLGGSAVAADLPLKAPPAPAVAVPTWTGTYIGINGGWGHATSRHTPLSGTVLGTSDFDQDGGMAGITYGGNWQSGQWVLGFESDLDWADMKGSVTDGVVCSSNGGATCFTKLKTFSTTRMRAGIDLDGWLLFGTAGAGFGRVDAGQDPCGVTPFGGNSCNEKWRTGWVAGPCSRWGWASSRWPRWRPAWRPMRPS